MNDAKLFALYKKECEVGEGNFCLINAFDKGGFCHSPCRSSDERGVKGCCQILCSFCKPARYDLSEFVQCFNLLYHLKKRDAQKIYDGIFGLLDSIPKMREGL